MFEKLKQLFHIHSWGKWEEYKVSGYRRQHNSTKWFKIYQTWQKRVCKECGYEQRRKIVEHA